MCTPGTKMWQLPEDCGDVYSPALVAVDNARDTGLSGMDALAAAVPVLLNRSALTMPCREMCEAIVSTCGCNKDYRCACYPCWSC